MCYPSRRHRAVLSGATAVVVGGLMASWLTGAEVVRAQEQQQPAAQGGEGEVPWEDQPYIVKDGKVDFGTYNGYRRYGGYCLRCHGPDGAGSSYAPSLVDSLKTLTYEQFLEVVVYGRQNVNQARESVMPAFGEVTDVMTYIDDIYAYLEARADGVLGRGRPERLPPEQDPVWQERKEE